MQCEYVFDNLAVLEYVLNFCTVVVPNLCKPHQGNAFAEPF